MTVSSLLFLDSLLSDQERPLLIDLDSVGQPPGTIMPETCFI